MDIRNTASLKSIFWHQGQFLQPQHFQHNDLLQQQTLSTMMRVANPFFYGSILLEIDEKSLGNDVFAISNSEFLMPDGLFVDVPDHASLQARSFTSAWTDRNQPFNVYIGIRKMISNEGNVTLIANKEKLPDVNTR